MHLLSSSFIVLLFLLMSSSSLLRTVSGLDAVLGQYGETLEIPCNNGVVKADDVLLIKWKYDKGEGLSGDLLVKQKNQNLSIIASDEYKGRVNMASNASLLLSSSTLRDQRTFTCMVVAGADIAEYPVNVLISKTPAVLEISDKAEELEIGKVMKLGTCVAKDAHPAANITWLKNNKPLESDGKRVSVVVSEQVDPLSGLFTTSSTLKYSAEKEDADAEFSCTSESVGQRSSAVTFTITYSTENIVLEVLSQDPLVEGDNVTLKCVADGNPAPTSFTFHLKGETVKVENTDTFTIINVSRETSGEYRCSLINKPELQASENVLVHYLDVTLNPSGSVVKKAGEDVNVSLLIEASGETVVSWTKDKIKLDKEPEFTALTFSHSGLYESKVTMGQLSRDASFQLRVQGAPVITQLSKQRGEDGQHKVLTCEAEGFPEPAVSWSINGSSPEEQSSFIDGKISHRLTVVPSVNLTVFCTVVNQFGSDSKSITVSSLFVVEVRMDKQDQSEDKGQMKMAVGVVVGLLLATMVVALIYGLYVKKSKQGSWKTGEENGSSEEEKKLEEKLEEKVEESSQKAEV
ncbi:CD166 antigen-like A-like isoform X1 [Solea senegalensis]|uniref:CD166 antigen-like A-like isoform X1 n=1 Tax=Solea senegalensis TaxID=28829 RepID=A0AAV6PHL6_SOLSE|nr:CD166 antigen homolog A-like isoform X1 [Solea senegalensis]KAG7465564.1 CD166 antigen-like A-like isoform X1 [Solea senegalensis]